MKKGTKGLKISFTILIILNAILLFFLIFSQGFPETFRTISRLPSSEIDFLAVFAGVLIFIAIPFTLTIYAETFKK